MAQDLANVIVGQTGKVYTAPTGTAAPTDAVTAWGVGWIDLGTIAEDGLTLSFNEDTTEIRQWGGGVVRKLITGSEVTFAFICLESSPEVVAAYYRSVVDDGALEIKAATRDERMWGMDVLDGDTHTRFVIERGEVSEREDVTYRADQAAQYGFTVTAYQDENQVAAVQYSDLASWAPVGP